jgi:hypothetical protein
MHIQQGIRDAGEGIKLTPAEHILLHGKKG